MNIIRNNLKNTLDKTIMSFFIEVLPKLENDEIKWKGHFYYGGYYRYEVEGKDIGDMAKRGVNKYAEMCGEQYNFSFVNSKINKYELEFKFYRNGILKEVLDYKLNYIYTDDEDYFQILNTDYEIFINHGDNYNQEFKEFKEKVEKEILEAKKEELKEMDFDTITGEAEWKFKQAIEVTNLYYDSELDELLNQLY